MEKYQPHARLDPFSDEFNKPFEAECLGTDAIQGDISLFSCACDSDARQILDKNGLPIKGAGHAGLGVAILSAATVSKEVKLGDLVAIPLDPPLRRPLSLVYSPDKFRSKLLDAFIAFVEERFRMCETVIPIKKTAGGKAGP